MDPATLSLLVAALIIVPLLVAGVHIGAALGLAGVIGSIVFTGSWSAGFGLPLIQSLDVASSYTLMVIPLFIAMGTIAGHAGITYDLFAAFYRWIGRVPGGVAVATIGTCAGMASITGSSLAVSAAMAKIALPELRRYRYDDGLSLGSIAMGGTVAIMIPPSITLVLYAIFAEQSVGQMLIAGVFPGLLTTLLYILMIIGRCKFNPELGPAGPKFAWAERWRSLPSVLPFFGIVAAIILGILFGIWTPTESAAVGLLVVLAMAGLRRRITWAKLFPALLDAVIVSASVMMVVIGSLIFGNFVALNGFSQLLTDTIVALDLQPFLLFCLLFLVYLLLGTMMEATSILALTVPLVLPIVHHVGWHPVWFGVVLVSLMEVAAVTPPVGLNLFVVKASVPGIKLSTIYIGSAPFWCMNFLVIFALYQWPQIALYLPLAMLQ
jgi:tripartite ATP-independent transporter DctM subunit